MIRELVIHPDERLRAVAYDVNDYERAQTVRRDLLDTMADCGAHGLAAVQIGEMVRMFAVDMGEQGVKVYANPVIKASSGSTKTREGCMSLPGVYGVVKRPRKIKVEVNEVTINGMCEREVLELSGFVAVVVQHEIDHLDGVLFIDKIMEAPP